MNPDLKRESADRVEENARFEQEFKEGAGRPTSEYTFADGMLVPELIALMITEDRHHRGGSRHLSQAWRRRPDHRLGITR